MDTTRFEGSNKDFQKFIEALKNNGKAIQDLRTSLDKLAKHCEDMAEALEPCEECDGAVACYTHCTRWN